MNRAFEHWRKSTNAKVEQIRNLHRDLLANLPNAKDPSGQIHFNQQFKLVKQATEDLIAHFGPPHAPRILSDFRDALTNWENNLNHPDLLYNVVSAKALLPEIMKYSDEPPSFTALLDGHASDSDLEEAVGALIQKLEEMLVECSDVVSSQVEKELVRLVESLKAARGKSIINLTAWLDLVAKFAAKIAEKYCGLPFCSIAFDALKLALASKATVMVLIDQTEKEFVLKIGLPILKSAHEDYKELPSVEQVEKKIGERRSPPQLAAISR